MEALRPWHLLIVAAFFVLLFGAKRLPDIARSLGRTARIMKSELNDLQASATEPTLGQSRSKTEDPLD